MDLAQILLASAAVIATVISICQIIGKKFDKMENKIDKINNEIKAVEEKLTKEIQKNREDILWLKFRLDPYEHPKWDKEGHEEPKEN